MACAKRLPTASREGSDLIIGSVREEQGLHRPTCHRAQLPRWTVGEGAREAQHAIAAALMV